MRVSNVLPTTDDDGEDWKPDKENPARQLGTDGRTKKNNTSKADNAGIPPAAQDECAEEDANWQSLQAVAAERGDNLDAHSEEAFALAFSARHADNLRYCDKFKSWSLWDGTRWKRDEVRAVFTLARALCRDQQPKVEPQHSASVTSSRMRAAVVALAGEDPRHVTAFSDWDADPWALNTPGGTVDLRTGKLHRHDPAALHSKITAVTPDRTMARPIWESFLDAVTTGDKELQAYLARLAGYCLTGDTREHALAFLYGTGANGKGVFLNTLRAIVNDYARVAPMETFTDSKSDRHPTDIAMLMGARLVTAQETEEGRRWAESKIKSMTGGDPVTARFMRQDFFEYQPQFKLLFAGNHKPSLSNVDQAIKRRFHLVPFTVTFPPERRDLSLQDKLQAEWPAILAWVVDGCLEWQRIGLAPPSAVLDASDEYFEDEDSFGAWLEECCERADHSNEPTADIFASWKAWADRNGLWPGSSKQFSEKMVGHGFLKWREPIRNGRRGFSGLGLKRTDYTDDSRYGE